MDAEENPQQPEEMRSQITLTLDNLETVLRAADMGLTNIIRLNIYTTDVDEAMKHSMRWALDSGRSTPLLR